MDIETLAKYWPLLAEGMLLGLILSVAFRRRSWASLVWVPTFSAFAVVSLLIGGRILGLGAMRGPDAGWGGLEIIFLLPILGVCLVGLIVCLVCRPKGGWNPKAFIPATGLTVAALGWMVWSSESNIELQLRDAQGRALTQYLYSINNAPMVDGAGILRFELQRGRGEHISIFTVSDSDPDLIEGGCSLGFRVSKNDRGMIEVWQSWSRFGLSEGFRELFPFKHKVVVPVTFPPKKSLSPFPDRTRLRKAFDAIKADPKDDSSPYGDFCRNLGAIEFMPELIASYGGSRSRQFNVMEGLKAIAATLSDLNDHCREVRKELGRGKDSRAKVSPLCAWAGVPFDASSDPNQALDQVEAEIARQARPLTDFCLQDGPGEKRPPFILSELGMINRPRLQEFVARLFERPPEDMQAALSWSDVFFHMGTRKSEVRALIDSPNPLLQAAARDVRPD